MIKSIVNKGAKKQSFSAVWAHYHRLSDDLNDAQAELCTDTKTRFLLYHKIVRMQLLRGLLGSILSRYSSDTLVSLSLRIGMDEGQLSRILNDKEYEMTRETEIKLCNYLQNKK